MSDKEGKEVLGMDSNATYISPSDFEKIIDSIPLIIRSYKCSSYDIEMLLRITRWSALRPGETLKLHKEDFHLDRKNRYIILKGTKTKKYDKVTIPNEGVKPIMKWLQTKPNGKIMEYQISWVFEMVEKIRIC